MTTFIGTTVEYPLGNQKTMPISMMSKGFIKTELKYIERTGKRKEYEEPLKKELKFKSRITFVIPQE